MIEWIAYLNPLRHMAAGEYLGFWQVLFATIFLGFWIKIKYWRGKYPGGWTRQNFDQRVAD